MCPNAVRHGSRGQKKIGSWSNMLWLVAYKFSFQARLVPPSRVQPPDANTFKMDSSIDDSIPNPESSRLFDDDDPIDAELHKRKASEIVDEDELGGPSKSQKLTATLNEKIYAPSSIHRFQEAPIPPEQCATLPKDSSYYFEDGNVILLVYDTYFKVTRSRSHSATTSQYV